jgi:hypothetical protein
MHSDNKVLKDAPVNIEKPRYGHQQIAREAETEFLGAAAPGCHI